MQPLIQTILGQVDCWINSVKLNYMPEVSSRAELSSQFANDECLGAEAPSTGSFLHNMLNVTSSAQDVLQILWVFHEQELIVHFICTPF